MKTQLFLLALLPFFFTDVHKAVAGFRPIVLSVGTGTVTVQVSNKPGMKLTNIDSSGNEIQEGPRNVVTYQVPSSARIEVDGLPSKLSDILPGMTVDVSQDMDPTTAASIVARTVPPAVTPKVISDPKGAIAKLHRSQTHSLSQGVGREIVVAITPERITFATPGTPQAKAAFITPQTGIVVDDRKSDVSAISAGMFVEVSTMDGTHADHIRAENVYYEESDH